MYGWFNINNVDQLRWSCRFDTFLCLFVPWKSLGFTLDLQSFFFIMVRMIMVSLLLFLGINYLGWALLTPKTLCYSSSSLSTLHDERRIAKWIKPNYLWNNCFRLDELLCMYGFTQSQYNVSKKVFIKGLISSSSSLR